MSDYDEILIELVDDFKDEDLRITLQKVRFLFPRKANKSQNTKGEIKENA